MDNPIAIDENHPGWKNLVPKERRLFKRLRSKDDDDELSQQEKVDFENLKDIIRNGTPVDENHPGWKTLIPKEKRRWKNYRAKEDMDEELDP